MLDWLILYKEGTISIHYRVGKYLQKDLNWNGLGIAFSFLVLIHCVSTPSRYC
jgi:hypothetical protein